MKASHKVEQDSQRNRALQLPRIVLSLRLKVSATIIEPRELTREME
ncbi:MAG TPA: hypothetical protein VMW72_23375 [Sedimentisphaerales bacterium]|nr:hypothetical protein [Sedimentisphaerales bacterium]